MRGERGGGKIRNLKNVLGGADDRARQAGSLKGVALGDECVLSSMEAW